VLTKTEPDPLMLVMPSDHVIDDVDALIDAVKRAATAARAGVLVSFGIVPKCLNLNRNGGIIP
jgi:mannose-1-phosphate guanylyltransferase/mannose-6-phosphate isomerase